MKKYGLLGRKLGHSYSPVIHSFLGKYEYALYEREPEQLNEFFSDASVSGFNVTIPYKKDALKYCKIITSIAERTKCVNTVIRKHGNYLLGENTDYYGFMYMIKKSRIDIEGKKVLLLGDGGSAATIKVVIEDLNAKNLVTISRRGPVNYESIHLHYDSDIIINSTPVGMFPNNGEAVIDISKFKNCIALFDLIYNPAQTKLMYDAKQLGIPSYNGLTMLVAQAKKASELFTSSVIDDSVIENIIDKVSKKSMNIVIIGMPGSGKSTVGRALAKLTDRCFIDTDDEVSRTYHKDTAEIIVNEGESFFRDLETQILENVTKKSNCVISTGGGIVTRGRNKYLIQQNSIIVYLKRDISLLSTYNRPLSQINDLKELFESRVDKYEGWSDYQVDCDDISNTHIKIKEMLGL